MEYLCTSMLGETVVLDSCYPKNRRYRKADLQGLIDRVKSGKIVGLDEFRDAVAPLKPF